MASLRVFLHNCVKLGHLTVFRHFLEWLVSLVDIASESPSLWHTAAIRIAFASAAGLVVGVAVVKFMPELAGGGNVPVKLALAVGAPVPTWHGVARIAISGDETLDRG